MKPAMQMWLQKEGAEGGGAEKPSPSPAARPCWPRLACVLAVALPLLLWGIAADWQLLHEDNGALHTTFALAHLRLGLGVTRGHAFFVAQDTGQAVLYGHHPPGVPLLVAAAFAITGSEQPWAARLVPVTFHLLMLGMLTCLLFEIVPRNAATAAGLFAAVVPMSAYFGRMVNFEAPGLASVVAQLLGWWWLRTNRGGKGLALLMGGVVFGGFIDWPPLVAAFSIAAVEAKSFGERPARQRALLVGGTAAVTLWVVLVHLWWVGGGTLAPLAEVLARSHPGGRAHNVVWWLGGVLDTARRYFTLSGVVAAFLTLAALVRPRGQLSGWLGLAGRAEVLALLAVAALAPAVVTCSAPTWAAGHAYWQIYFLPLVVLSFGLLWQALTKAKNRHCLLPSALLVLVVSEVVATSTYMLVLRHTRVSEYALQQTARLREQYFAPAHPAEASSSGSER